MSDHETANGVPVLMYHSISERPSRETAGLAVRPGAFADQMALLRERGFTPVPFSAVATPPEGGLPDKPVVITFDDGYADFHEHALPVLDEHGFTATVFVTTGWLADAGDDAAGRPLDRMLAWEQVREAAAHGIEIGGHSHSHPQLDQLGDADLRSELTRNRGLLEDRLGRAVTTMAYPYGYSSVRVRRAVRAAGYDAACSVENRLGHVPQSSVPQGTDPDRLAIPRLTVRMSTSLDTFGRVVDGRGIPLIYLKDRALTRGYAVVRRTRYAARRVSRRV
ncbi:polysaccharide deacetylase family protein [Actinomadura rudentiformis]|uniref:Polysaccharide deacetylase family protein n=1 Tax=Actinomadura rudentiformis TaxID=359158 RepID=A0A6H9YDP1_9ACTN|nr:polysaccharide deacetylase family protein [Actinomadura rudentiformis]KAB2342368.1 polysaccharide deacetylase family protein [Actinomadura rudentiformis]